MKKRKLLIALCIALIILAAYVFDIGRYLNIPTLQLYKNQLIAYVDHHQFLSLLIFMTVYAIFVGLSLPGAAFFSIAGGFLFGIALGTMANIIGATIGSTGAFLLARYLLGTSLQNQYQEQLKRFNQELDNYGSFYLLIVRLIPIFPLFVINFLCGLTSISLQTFIITTAVGIIPGALAFTTAGNSLRTATSIKDIFTTPFIIAVIVLVMLALLGLWYKKSKQSSSTI